MNCVISRKSVCVTLLLLATAAISLSAQTFTTLHTFDLTDGAYPSAPLVQGLDGNLYSTTYGGARNICSGGCGTIFKVTPSGALTTVHEFIEADGVNPTGLVLASNGNFYGATNGGSYGSKDVIPFFELTSEGTFVSIVGSSSAVTYFSSPLMQDTIDGNFYGTTANYGNKRQKLCDDVLCGSVFQITPSGTTTFLYSFCNLKNCADGWYPTAPLVQGSNGFLYGLTNYGGSGMPYPNGTIFKIGTKGALNILDSIDFTNVGGNDTGAPPAAGLIEGSDGNFYGTLEVAAFPNCPNYEGNCGVIFKITPEGAFTIVHSFDGSDGAGPLAALIQANDGNFYGTTSGVGSRGVCSGTDCGTIFKMTPGGTLTTLHSFDKTDGMNPTAALVQGTDGNIYGTTNGFVGQHLYGTVFKLSLGLAPFVETAPTAAYPGTTIFILGTDLTGATGVTFNGKAAAFTVVSPTEITATVPKGSTTGTVQVVTPSGTLSSNIAFRVF
jgi:uncharacterized repeat protein (TIGR03803 family)